jgi:hypothetical protein
MQQRQLRLGDILDDYCPRERRLTNHAVVAMIGDEVKQTRCTTCDAEHEYKHARVPRQRRKPDTPAALYAQVAAGGPKRVPHDSEGEELLDDQPALTTPAKPSEPSEPAAEQQLQTPNAVAPISASASADEAVNNDVEEAGDERDEEEIEEGPVHRPLIRATLPRAEGQPPARPGPDFTIRQPGGRANRFRPRHQRGGGQQFFGNRANGNMGGGGRPPHGSMSRSGRRQGPGRKRSK